MGNRQWAEHNGVDQTENSRVRANAQGEGEDSDGGEAGDFAQHAQAEAEVLHEVVPPEPAAGFVEALLSLGDVSEGAPRRPASLFFAQTLLFQLLRLELKMRFDLRCEVILFALSPEHHLNPPRPRVPEPARWPSPADLQTKFQIPDFRLQTNAEYQSAIGKGKLRTFYNRSALHLLKTKFQIPDSRFQTTDECRISAPSNRRSAIENRQSKISSRKSAVENQQSKNRQSKNRQSKIGNRKSAIEKSAIE